jgi:hypothetical protein
MGSDDEVTRRDGLVALAFAVAFAFFIALSWQKWPLVTADSARELYVPFQMLRGQRLYEDFYYLYGPVAPVLNSALLAAFGARLEVLYVASLLNLALIMGLLYALARQLLGPWPSAMVLFVFFTHFALGRDIWGYAWPYAFAATYGVTLGLTLLVALARFMATGRLRWLVVGGVAMGLSVVTKLEYGFAAAALGAAFLAGRGLLRPRLAQAEPGLGGWVREALALGAPAVAVSGAIVGAVLARVPLATVLESVWPVALMKAWNSTGTWHGNALTWATNAKWVLLEAFVVVALVGLAALWRFNRWAAGAGAVALLGLVAVARGPLGFYLDNAHLYWMGPGFLLLFGVLAWVVARLVAAVRDRSGLPDAVVLWGLIAVYGCLVASRTLMTGYNDYTRYQAPVALIAWVALLAVWLPGWLRKTGWLPDARPVLVGLALLTLLLGGRHVAVQASSYTAPHVPVTSDVGTVMAQAAFGVPFNQALGYVKANIRAGEAIVAAPNEASFYLFTGIDNVLKEDQLFYGYLTTPESQHAAIARMAEGRVRYVLLSNYGFGDLRFGETYMQVLGAWLKRDCKQVARYGTETYRITVYETPFALAPALAR